MNPKDLKNLRDGLLNLHREVIQSERIVFERSAGTIPSAAAFLDLLAHDPWFEWMRPLSGLITEIDSSFSPKAEPLTEEMFRTFFQNARTLLTPDPQADGFQKNYDEVLQRDPHLMIDHIELRRAIDSILKPTT